MNDKTDPLAQRSVPCPDCRGTGKVTKYQLRFPRTLPIDAYKADCPVCHGSKTVPEPAEEWAERCAAIAQRLAKRLATETVYPSGLWSDIKVKMDAAADRFIAEAADAAARKAAEG